MTNYRWTKNIVRK